jgi:hypothetical protein
LSAALIGGSLSIGLNLFGLAFGLDFELRSMFDR